MKINAQTPFEIQLDGKVKFFVGGQWSSPIDMPEFMKYRQFLRYKEWEYDTDTQKIRIYQGEGNWSSPVDPPASIGAGGGSTVTSLVVNTDIQMQGADTLVEGVLGRTGSINQLRLQLQSTAGVTAGGSGAALCTLSPTVRPEGIVFAAAGIVSGSTITQGFVRLNGYNGSIFTYTDVPAGGDVYINTSYIKQ